MGNTVKLNETLKANLADFTSIVLGAFVFYIYLNWIFFIFPMTGRSIKHFWNERPQMVRLQYNGKWVKCQYWWPESEGLVATECENKMNFLNQPRLKIVQGE